MDQSRYHPNLQPRHGQNGIGNLEHDHIMSYLIHNSRMNGSGSTSDKDRLIREKRRQRRRIKDCLKHRMTANTSATKFELVRHVLESLGFTLEEDELIKSSYLVWTDHFISQERITELKSYQHINHFLGMSEISRKDTLAKKFSKLQKLRPNDYDYFPKTWILPQEQNLFQKHIKENKDPKRKKYFIYKPANGAMGMGIKLFSEDDPIKVTDTSIVQEYIDRPFLLDGYKNDLRIYVLITSCDPLRIFIYREGLVRLSTEKYVLPTDPKSESLFMHLTNYAVNKKNSKYSKGTDEYSGSKRSLSALMNRLNHQYRIDTNALWKRIVDIVVKTILMVQPNLFHNYKMCRPGQNPSSNSVCFEILGFDILLDERLRPWLLEVNRAPSFGSDEALDRKVKGSLITDALRLINVRRTDKERYENMEKQKAARRLTLAAARSKIDTQLDQESLRKRKDIDKKKQELLDLLAKVKSNAAREYFENRHSGNFYRIFPTDDKTLFDHYGEILIDSFITFNQLNSQTAQPDPNQAVQQMTQCIIQNHYMEEDILEKIRDCEKEENRILEKFGLPQNADQTTILPDLKFYETSSDEDEDSVKSDDSEFESSKAHSMKNSKNNKTHKDSTAKKSVSSPIPTNVLESRLSSKLAAYEDREKKSENNSGLGRRIKSTKCEDQYSENSLKADDYNVNKSNSDGIHGRGSVNDIPKKPFTESPLYLELLKIVSASLQNLNIRYPGQSDEKTKTLLGQIRNNWDSYRTPVATYWLVSLNSKKRQQILNIVKNNVDLIINENFKYTEDAHATQLNRLFGKIYTRLLWNRGHGLIQCFSNLKSWKLIFASNEDQIKPLEMDICGRVVQLCLDCVLIVYHFSLKLSETEKQKSLSSSKSHSVLDNYHTSEPNRILSLTPTENL